MQIFRLFIILFLSFASLYSAELLKEGIKQTEEQLLFDNIASIKTYPSINLTELTLKNGMKICLKPTSFDPGEVSYQLVAKGGYGSLPVHEMASGMLAGQIGWESGLGKYTGDQASVLLYEHCLEFFPKIQPYSRIIEGSSLSDGMEHFFKCIRLLFTEKRFTDEGFAIAMAQAKNGISKSVSDHEQNYESYFLEVNTGQTRALCALKECDLKNVSFEAAEKFYSSCFSDPSEFICVIVGSFDVEEAKKLINDKLGIIPKVSPTKKDEKLIAAPFPKGVTHKTMSIPPRAEYISRLTLPLLVPLSEDNIHTFEFTCQIIEARLRNVLIKEMNFSHGIDVAYEFPLYPNLENAWITIQFRSDVKSMAEITEIVLGQLKKLQNNGPTSSEIEEIKRLQNGSEEYWWSENCYWVSILSNFYLWQWNPEKIKTQLEDTANLTEEQISKVLRSYFNVDQYSVISTKPNGS